jgi:large subunit ribosomal protein L25
VCSSDLIKLNGDTHRCILKDLQFDKVTDKLIHVDLLELVEDKKVIASIPLKFVGNPVGVKEGGKLHIKIKALKVKTFPKYLREHIDVNIDNLELNGNVRVEDVRVDNYEIMNSPRIPIASVTLTRELKQEEAATTTATTATPAAGAAGAATPASATATPAAATPAKK